MKSGKPAGKTKSKKLNAFDQLLQSLDREALADFIRAHASRNKKFKQEFELHFADKQNDADIDKSNKQHVQQLVKQYERGGNYFYQGESAALAKEMQKILDTASDHVTKQNFRSAFAIAKAVSAGLLEAITFGDDSGGHMSDTIDEAIYLLETVAHSADAAVDLKEQLLAFLETELKEKDHFSYGDFGYHLYQIFHDLAFQLNKPDYILRFIDMQLAAMKGSDKEYRLEFFLTKKIEVLEQTGKVEEARVIVSKNLDVDGVRLGEVEKAIASRDFTTAKELIAGGINIAEGKRLAGVVADGRKNYCVLQY